MDRKKGSSIERVLQIVEEVAKAERPLSAAVAGYGFFAA